MGTHLVVDAWQAPAELLNEPQKIREALISAISVGEATLINLCIHQFSPQGITATATLAESHIAIHTWPEHGYFAADLFFCGQGKPESAMQVLQTILQAKEVKVQQIKRGFFPDRLEQLPRNAVNADTVVLRRCNVDQNNYPNNYPNQLFIN